MHQISQKNRSRRGRIVVRFTITYAISAHHHERCEFESHSWRGVLDTTLSLLVTCGRSGVFSTNKTECHNINIVESGIKHHNPNL